MCESERVLEVVVRPLSVALAHGQHEAFQNLDVHGDLATDVHDHVQNVLWHQLVLVFLDVPLKSANYHQKKCIWIGFGG